MLERRKELGGFLPERRVNFTPLKAPSIEAIPEMVRPTIQRTVRPPVSTGLDSGGNSVTRTPEATTSSQNQPFCEDCWSR